MSRPVDSYDEIYWQFSPRDVVFSGWVGDQDPDFSGLQDALRNMFHSAWDNYVGYGSDIGGYRGGGPPPFGRTKTLLIRWAQMGAFCSLMENGGNGEHRPWKFDDTNQTLNIYRYFVNNHMELQTYLLSAGTTAYILGISIMKPIAAWTVFTPDSWNYWLWRDVLVCPMVDNSTTREVIFPKNDDFVDWYNSSYVYKGGSTIVYNVPLEIFPVFHRRGSLLPLEVTNEIAGHGDSSSSDALTLLLLHPKDGQAENITIADWKIPTQEISYTFSSSKSLFFSISAHNRTLLFCIKGITLPKIISIQKEATQEDKIPFCAECSLPLLKKMQFGWAVDSKEQDKIWIRIPGTSLTRGAIVNLVGAEHTFRDF